MTEAERRWEDSALVFQSLPDNEKLRRISRFEWEFNETVRPAYEALARIESLRLDTYREEADGTLTRLPRAPNPRLDPLEAQFRAHIEETRRLLMREYGLPADLFRTEYPKP